MFKGNFPSRAKWSIDLEQFALRNLSKFYNTLSIVASIEETTKKRRPNYNRLWG